MREDSHNVAYMLGVVLGALVATAAALLWTPLSGHETRAYLGMRRRAQNGDERPGS